MEATQSRGKLEASQAATPDFSASQVTQAVKSLEEKHHKLGKYNEVLAADLREQTKVAENFREEASEQALKFAKYSKFWVQQEEKSEEKDAIIETQNYEISKWQQTMRDQNKQIQDLKDVEIKGQKYQKRLTADLNISKQRKQAERVGREEAEEARDSAQVSLQQSNRKAARATQEAAGATDKYNRLSRSMVECNSAITEQLHTAETDLAALEKWKEEEVIQKDKLCTACSERIFDGNLECGHPICNSCYKKLSNQRGSASCPICRSTSVKAQPV